MISRIFVLFAKNLTGEFLREIATSRMNINKNVFFFKSDILSDRNYDLLVIGQQRKDHVAVQSE